MEWIILEEVIVGYYKCVKPNSELIAGFDLDDTLVEFNSCRIKKNAVNTLRLLTANNYSIVIFTNQAGLKTENKIIEWCSKVKLLLEGIDVPAIVYCAHKKNNYRKPHVGSFNLLRNTININKSFYCGDAGGRLTPKDFANSDRNFAHNCGLLYFTPEQIFLSSSFFKIMYLMFELFTDNAKDNIADKKVVIQKHNYKKYVLPFRLTNISYKQYITENLYPLLNIQMVIMIGSPASGKSKLSRLLEKEKGYKIISRDILKTEKKCLDKVKEYIEDNKKVVIDNTNPDDKARKCYAQLAKTVLYVYMETSKELSFHLEQVRVANGKKHVPQVAFNIFYKRLRLPENYIKIPFICSSAYRHMHDYY